MSSNRYRAERRRYTEFTAEDNHLGIERPAHLAPHGDSAPFHRLIALFEWCSKKKLELRRRYLTTWFDNWRKLVGPDLYPAMRLLLPQKDRERATYGFKEAALAKAFIASFGLNEKSKDAQSLIHWKKPGDDGKSVGDFPNILFQTIKARSSVTEGSLSIEQVNGLLDDLSKSFRVSSKLPERKALIENVFKTFTEKCTANELRWICRIILKDLSIGMKENTVFSVFHPDAMDLYNSCSDLQKICYDLADPQRRLNDEEKRIGLFRPFQPMLCGRSNTTQEAFRLMMTDKDDQGFIMEEKLDGERIQLHKRGNEFYFCSRKGKDYTYLYGSNISNGSLVPFIKDAFHPQLTDLVLDGEMMVWDPEIEKYLPFGNLKTSALEKNPGPGKPHPCFKIFDILYIRAGGAVEPTVLTNKTLGVRLGVLKDEKTGPDGRGIQLFREIPGRLEFALQRSGHDMTDVQQFLQEVVEERGEGLVLKKRKSPYILAGRDNRKWVKVKPEYMDDMGETVDVLVVGASWGSGRRGGRVSSLICAVRANQLPSTPGNVLYQTFVRIGTGLNFGDYEWINAKPWKPLDKDNIPAWLIVAPVASDDKGDLYLEPEDSFIITIKAATIGFTDQYGCGLTMRFPRCKEIRHDLSIDDCLTYTDLLGMTAGKRKADDQPATAEVAKKRKTTGRQIMISGAHKGADVDGVEAQSALFDGMKFHVIPSRGSRLSKQDLEKMIHENGGSYHQTIKVSGTIAIYGGNVDSPPVAGIIRKGEKDIVKSEWIEECVREKKLIPLSKRYFYFATDERKRNPEYHGSHSQDFSPGDPEDGEATDNEREDENELDDSALPNDPESRSWILPAREEDEEDALLPSSSKGNKKRPIIDDPESDTLSESSEREDEDPYDFGVLSVSDDEMNEMQTPHLEAMTDGRQPGRQASPDYMRDSPESGNQLDLEMGEDPSAKEYDPELLFKHLMFYLDSPSNANKNGLDVPATSVVQAAAEKEFAKIENLITENGGRTTSNIDEAKMTHVVLFKRDISRRVALMRKTSTPKRRHLVLTTFVAGCIQEESLLDEDAFAP